MSAQAVGEGVWVVTAGSFPSNSYICEADVTGGAVLVDAGLDPEPIDLALDELGLTPAALFCTHGHFDHVGSASFFQNKYGIPIHLHRADAKTAAMSNFLLTAMNMSERLVMPEFTWVDDDFRFHLGRDTLHYRHAPGHSPGSCVLQLRDQLFSGDTIYAQGVGLSKLPGERLEQLRRSISQLWDRLDQVIVHPGHGPSAAGMDIRTKNAALLRFLDAAGHQKVA